MAGRHRKLPPPRRGGHGRHRKPPSRPHAVIPTVTAVAVIAVGGVVFGHAIAHGQSPHGAVAAPEPPAVQAPVIPPPTPAPSPAVKAAKASKASKAARHPRVKPAALTVTDVGSACYIQVTSTEGHLLVRKILQPGQHLAFRHHGLRVVLGNAGGVRISIDGHRAHSAGRSGQVRSFRVG
jgi:hypothetical protein